MRDAGIFDGDLLAVQKRSEAKDGQIIICPLGDDVTVKRLKPPGERARTDRREPRLRKHLRETGMRSFALEGTPLGLIRPGEF